VIAAAALALALGAQGAPRCAEPWPLWDRYASQFVTHDGRVADPGAAGRTVSEAQAYALFFALVARDRARFARVLRWTDVNLARGKLGDALPAWTWGKDAHGRWRVLDRNSAADADLWLGYTLLEAGRLWKVPRYATLGRRVLATVVRREVLRLPDGSSVLLPAPTGFVLDARRVYRLNPSYAPPQLLARFRSARVPGPWTQILATSTRMLRDVAPLGLVPDWAVWQDGRFGVDPVTGSVGSYDAIRVYLWAGMMPDAGAAGDLLPATRGLLDAYRDRGQLPERVDVVTGSVQGRAPPGFVAALVPLAHASGDDQLAARLAEELARQHRRGLYGDPPGYYDQNLALFATGFADGRFRFAPDGRLVPRWEAACRRR
jgi:endoglucanase